MQLLDETEQMYDERVHPECVTMIGMHLMSIFTVQIISLRSILHCGHGVRGPGNAEAAQLQPGCAPLD